MASLTVREITQVATRSGYTVVSAEQPRVNRILLTLADAAGATILVLVQTRSLIGAADVQDLAELARLRRPSLALLLAHGGSFSPAAQRTAAEFTIQRIRLCNALPPAASHAVEEPRGIPVNVAS